MIQLLTSVKYRLETMQSIDSLSRSVSVLLCTASNFQKMKKPWISITRIFLELTTEDEIWEETVAMDTVLVVAGAVLVLVRERQCLEFIEVHRSSYASTAANEACRWPWYT